MDAINRNHWIVLPEYAAKGNLLLHWHGQLPGGGVPGGGLLGVPASGYLWRDLEEPVIFEVSHLPIHTVRVIKYLFSLCLSVVLSSLVLSGMSINNAVEKSI